MIYTCSELMEMHIANVSAVRTPAHCSVPNVLIEFLAEQSSITIALKMFSGTTRVTDALTDGGGLTITGIAMARTVEQSVREFYDERGWKGSEDRLFRQYGRAYQRYHTAADARTIGCFAGRNGSLLI